MTEQDMMRESRKKFDGYFVKYIKLFGEVPVQVLELSKTDGTNLYKIRYVFDIYGRTITISGDFGEAIVQPTFTAEFTECAKYFAVGHNMEYFMEQVVLSSCRYVYDASSARAELMEIFLADDGKKPLESINDEVNEIMLSFGRNGFCDIPDDCEIAEILAGHGLGYGDYSIIGRCYAMWCHLWLAGLEYAFLTLKKEGRVS